MRTETLTREQTDRRIRGAARVAEWFCWVAALVALLLALFGAWSAIFLTGAAMGQTGRDPVTAFLTTSAASGNFSICDYGEQAPQVSRDADGNETGRAQVMGGEVSLSGSPVSSFANGAVLGGLACAAFAIAARMCSRIRRTGVPLEPGRARELGRVGWLVLLAGCAPTLLHMLLERVAMAVIDSLIAAGEMVRYSLTASFGPQDLMLVALGTLLVLVGRVFEYGCILQRQDDETL